MPLAAAIVATTLLADPQIKFKSSKETKKGIYEINLAWPTFLPDNPLNKLANGEVGDAVYRHVVEFRNGALEVDANRPAAWEHQVACTVSLATPTLISVLVDTYDYSGGAHPNTWTETVTVGLIGDKPKTLILKDILTENAEEREILDILILPRLSNQRIKRTGSPVDALPEGTNAKFLISKNGLTFPFDKYSVASYAEGEFIVKLTWKDLKGLINPKVIPYAVP